MTNISIAILTGGNSRRFGRPKQLYEIDGKPLFQICYEKLVHLSDDVFLQGRFDSENVKAREDLVKGKGPLGGLYSALVNARHEKVFISACDMPRLDPRIVSVLLSFGESDLVIPRWRCGYNEPLCALYSKKEAPIVERMIRNGVLKISELFSMVDSVAFPEIDGMIDRGLISSDCFLNVNKVRDFERF